ncbi:Hypothetical protein GLP15_2460 [Giardia lamblia P15]|uniref:Uncharacterized protein n=1 Tax=Giardia intestinalis (strain P15) TaxID=658858 RepID=E1F6R3_GIAIA|nr:Hypothetical protein GLP15_2460 [Giardia lamblia P15]
MFPGLPNPSKPVTDNDIMDAYLQLRKQTGSRSSSPTKSLSKPAALPKALKPIQVSHQMKLDTETASLAVEHRFTEHMYDLFEELENDPIFGEDGLLRSNGSLLHVSSSLKVPFGKEVGITDLAPSRFSTMSSPSPHSTSSNGLKTKDPLDIYLESAYSALDTVNTFDPSAADVLYRVIKWLVTDARVKPEEVARHKEASAHALALVADREKVIESLTKEKNSAVAEFEDLRRQIKDSESAAARLQFDLDSSRAEIRMHLEKISLLQADLLEEEKKFYDMKIERNKLAYRNTELVTTGVELRTQIEEFIKVQKECTSHDEEYTMEIRRLKNELDNLKEQYDDDIVAYQQIVGSKTELITDLTMQCNTAQNEAMILKDKLAYMQNCIMANKTVSGQRAKDGGLDGSLTGTVDQSAKISKGSGDQSDTTLQARAAIKKSKPTRGIAVQIGGDKDGLCIIAGEEPEDSEASSFIQFKLGDAGTGSQLLDLPSLAAFLSTQADAETSKVNTLLDRCFTGSPSKQPNVASNVIKRKIQLFNNQVSKYKELLVKLTNSENATVDLDIDSDIEFQITPHDNSTKNPNESPSKKTLHGISSSSDAQLKTDDIKTLQTIQAVLGETFTLEDLITNEELLRLVGEAKLNLLLGKLKQKGCSTFNASGLLSEASIKDADDSKLSVAQHPLPLKERGKEQLFAATGSHVKGSKKGSQKNAVGTEHLTRKKAPSFPQKASNHTGVKTTQKTMLNHAAARDGKLPQDEASQLVMDGRLEGQILQKITDISQIDVNLSPENDSPIEENGPSNLLPSDITEETPIYGYMSPALTSDIFGNDPKGSCETPAKIITDKNIVEKKPESVVHNRLSTEASVSQQKPVTAVVMTGMRTTAQESAEETRQVMKEILEPPARLQTPQDQQRHRVSPDIKQQAMYTVTAKQDSQLLTGMVVKATGPLISETPIRMKGTPSVQVEKAASHIYKSSVRQLNDQLVFTPGNPVKNIGKLNDHQDDDDESGFSSSSSLSASSHFEDDKLLKKDVAGRAANELVASPVQIDLNEDRRHKKRRHNSKIYTKSDKEQGILIQLQGKNPGKGSYTYLQTKNDKALQYEPLLEGSRAFSDVILTASHIYDPHFETALLTKSKQALERIKTRAMSDRTKLQMADLDHNYKMPANSILQGSQLLKRQQSEPDLSRSHEKLSGPAVTALFDGTIPHVDGVTSVAKKLIETKATDHTPGGDVSVSDLDLSGLRTYDTGSFASSKSVLDNDDPLLDMAQRAVRHFRLVGKSMQADDTPPFTTEAVTSTPMREEPLTNPQPLVSSQQAPPTELQEHKTAAGEVYQPSHDTSALKFRPTLTSARRESLVSQASSLLKKTAPILIRTFDPDPFSLGRSTDGKSSASKYCSEIESIFSLGMPSDEKSFELLRTAVSELVAKNMALYDEIEMLRQQLASAKSTSAAHPAPSISMACQSDPNLATIVSPTKADAKAFAAAAAAIAADSSHPKRQELRSFYPPKALSVPTQCLSNDLVGQQSNASFLSPPTNSFIEIKSHEGLVDTGSPRQFEMDQRTVNLDFSNEERAGSAVVKRKLGYEVLTHVAQVAHEPLIKPTKDIIHQSELYAYPLVDPAAEKTGDGNFGALLTYDAAITLAKSSISKSIIVKNRAVVHPNQSLDSGNLMQMDSNSEHVLILSDGSEDEFRQLVGSYTTDTFRPSTEEHHMNRILFRNHAKPLLGEYTSIKHTNGLTANPPLHDKNIPSARSAALPVLVTDPKAPGLKGKPYRSASASTSVQGTALQLFPAEDIDTRDQYLVRTRSCKAILITTQNEEPVGNKEVENPDGNIASSASDQKPDSMSNKFLQGLRPPTDGKIQLDEDEDKAIATGASLKYNPYMQKKVVPYGDIQTSRIHIQDNCEVVPADLLYKELTDEEVTRKCIYQSAQAELGTSTEKLGSLVRNRCNAITEHPTNLRSQRSSPKQSSSRSISPAVTAMGKNGTSTEPRLYTNAPLSPMRMLPQRNDETIHQTLQSRHMSYPSTFTWKEDKRHDFQALSPRRYTLNKRTESSFSLALKKEELRQRNELAKHIHILEAELALERQRVEMAQANPMMISCNYNPSAYPSAFFQVSDGFRTIMIKNLKSKPAARLLLRVGPDSLERNDASSVRAPAASRSHEPIYLPSAPVTVPLFEPTEAHQGLVISVKKEQNPDINEYVSFNDSLTYATALDCLLNEVFPLPPSIYNNTLASSTFLRSYIAKFPELVELRRTRASAADTLLLVPGSCPTVELGSYICDYRATNIKTHTYPLVIGDKVTMVFYKQEFTRGDGRVIESTPDPAIQFLVTNTPDLQLLRYNTTAIYALLPCHVKIKPVSWVIRLIRILIEEIANQGSASALLDRNMTIKRIHLWAKKKYGLQQLVTNLLWHLYCSLLFHRRNDAEVDFFARILCGDYDADQLNFYLSLRDPLMLSAGSQDKDKNKENCDSGDSSTTADKKQHVITLSAAFSVTDKLFPMLNSTDAYEVFGAILDNSTLVAGSKDLFKTDLRAHISIVKDNPDKCSSIQSLSVPVGTLETYVFIHILLSIYTSRRTVFNVHLIDLFEASASSAGPKAGLNLDTGLEILQKAWPYLHRETILSLVQRKNSNSTVTQMLHFDEFVELLAGLVITPPATIDPLLLQAKAGFAAAEQQAVNLIPLLDKDVPDDAALLQALDSLRQDAIVALQRHCSLKANVVVAEYLRVTEFEGMRRGFVKETVDTSNEVE